MPYKVAAEAGVAVSAAEAAGGVVELGDEQLASSNPLARSRCAAGGKKWRDGNGMGWERIRRKKGLMAPVATRAAGNGRFAAGVAQGLQPAGDGGAGPV